MHAAAAVVVIGPYRSGKSFLLNQLLSVPCDTGFGVGHTRATQTKGIWVWGAPLARPLPDGTQLSVLFVDTEGFESTGRSSAYGACAPATCQRAGAGGRDASA